MLYFVATPIGNLEDISFRAVNVLQSCDVIACEDTRHSAILLNHYNIKVKTIAYHKFNEQNSADGIIALLKEGKNVAVISDAGMPVISDPGNILAKKLHENNIKYTIIPGANAGLSALVLSGFDATKFAFFGFLSEKNKELKQQLVEVSNFVGTKILYSSKYNVNKDLSNLYSTLKDVKVAIVSEITKVHETTEIVTLPYEIKEPKGEYVLVVEQKKEEEKIEFTDEDILKEMKKLLKSNTKQETFKMLQTAYSVPKSYIYNLYEKNKLTF
ncbi:MAG: 16S rRNA (cytidine(1402)-2'-O)-methyltransferase [Clostridia bacterium]|nr:16S rRNA (cytidine(1402)-2'-O)-methyltransferase [Clostridia bacterium]